MSSAITVGGNVLTKNGQVVLGEIASGTVQLNKSYTVNSSGNKTISPDTGYTSMQQVSLTVPAGSAGTPSATKGAVSNHSIEVTPSVTNTSGYITGSTKTGDAVTVSASELVSGNKSITSNGNNIDVANYSTVSVSVSGGGGNTQSSKEYTVVSNGSQTINPDTGYDSMASVDLTVPAISMSIDSSPDSDYTAISTISRSTSNQYINISDGFNDDGGYYTISATPNGTVVPAASISGSSASITTGTNTLTLSKTISNTPNVSTVGYISSGTAGNSSVSLTASVDVNPTLTASGATVTAPAGYYTTDATKSITSGSATPAATISGSSASVSTGTNTLTLSKTISNTPQVSAGYISSGTAGNSSVSLTASVTTKGATTYHPSTSDQTIASGTYLTGAQTIKGVTISGLSADNIVSGVTVKIGDSTDDDCVASVTGTASGGGYFTVTDTTDTAGGTIRTITPTEGTAVIQASKSVTINSNTTTTITPDTGNTALGQVVVTTEVSGGGGDSNPVAVEKAVNFIDYDGTIRYSYTAAEFANLTALPANPTHTGLTAQGWNWTLADAKSYVSTYGKHCIGQNYVTDDGKTRVYVNIDADSLNPYIGLGVNGTVSIDWGDGSSLETVTGSNTSAIIYSSHTYSATGNYIIKFTPTTSSTYYKLAGNDTGLNDGTYLIRASSSITYDNVQYARTVYKIELGSNVYLDTYAFSNLRALEEITIPTSITKSSATGTLGGTGGYVFYYTQSLKCIVVPSGFTTIGGYYCNYSGISKISLPKSITTIGSTYAFSHCYLLKFIAVPPDVNCFQNYTFNYCYQLKAVGPMPYRTGTSGSTFPSYFFNYNYCLSSFVVPSGVTILNSDVFQYCTALKSVTLPSGLVTIGDSSFAYCRLLPSITIPTTVTTINTYAFRYCESLTSITTSATTIGTYAFTNCSSLTSVTLNGALTTLSNYLFNSCSALPTVTIPSTVTSIGTYVFQASGITSITIPANVSSIGTYALANCSRLAEIHFLGTTTTPTFGSACFGNLPSTCKIYVPTGYLSTYQGKTNAPSSSTYTWIEE